MGYSYCFLSQTCLQHNSLLSENWTGLHNYLLPSHSTTDHIYIILSPTNSFLLLISLKGKAKRTSRDGIICFNNFCSQIKFCKTVNNGNKGLGYT